MGGEAASVIPVLDANNFRARADLFQGETQPPCPKPPQNRVSKSGLIENYKVQVACAF
jgi:hypothetical protein